MLIIALHGGYWGAITAAVASAYTISLFGHPYAWITFTMEALAVGFLLRLRPFSSLSLLCGIFWCIVGLPFVWLVYKNILDFSPTAVTLYGLKQCVNSLFNAAVAELIVLGLASRSVLATPPSLSRMLSAVIVMMVLLPTYVFVILDSRDDVNRIETTVERQFQLQASIVQRQIQDWYGRRINILSEMTRFVARPSARQSLPERLAAFVDNTPTFQGAGILDTNGTILAEAGEMTPELVALTKTFLEEAVQGKRITRIEEVPKGAEAAGTNSILAVPLIQSGRLLGIAWGTLIMGSLERMLQLPTITSQNSIGVAVLNSAGKVIVANAAIPQNGLDIEMRQHTASQLSRFLTWSPGDVAGIPGSQRTQNDVYAMMVPIDGDTSRRILLFAPVKPFQEQLYGRYITNFGFLFILIFAALGIAQWVSRYLSKPLEELARASGRIPEELQTQNPFQFGLSAQVSEIHSLSRNFSDMARKLAQSFEALRQHGEQLQREVQQRAAAEDEIARLNRQLQHRVAELETIIDIAPIGIGVANDPDCKFISANKTFASIIRREGAGNVSMSNVDEKPMRFQVFRDGELALASELPMQVAAAQGIKVQGSEWDLIFDDGRVTNLLISAAPLFDENGNVRGSIGIHVDITSLKEAQEALRDNEERLRLALEASDIVVWDWAVDADHVLGTGSSSNQFLKAAGGRRVPVESITRYLHKNDRARVEQIAKEAMRTEHTHEMEFRLCLPDDSVRWVLNKSRVIRDSEGDPVRLIGVLLDLTQRKQVEEALRRSEEQLQLVTDALPALVSYLDRDSRYRFVNRHYEEWFSRSRSEILGRRSIEVIGEEAFEQVRPYVDRAISGERIQFEAELLYKEGKRVWISANYIPHYNDRDVLGYFALIQDITERKQAEEELRLSEERYRALVTATAQAVWIFTDQLNENGVNWWANLTGQPKEELSSWKWLEAVHPDDRGRVCESWLKSLSEQTSYNTEYRVRSRTGDYRHLAVRAVPVFNKTAKHWEWIGIFVDVTEQKQAEVALRESESRFRLMADSSPAMIWLTDTQGGLSWCNRAWLEFVGRSVEQETGEGWTENIHPEERSDVWTTYRAALNLRQPFEKEYRIRRHNSQTRWMLNKAVAVIDVNGDFRGYVGSCIDITESKLKTQELETMVAERTAELSETIAELEAFSYTISHDMRAPLRAMQGYARMLIDDYGNQINEEGLNYLQRIMTAAIRQDRLIRDVLSYSKIVREQAVIEPINLAELIEDLIAEYPNLQEPGIRIEIVRPMEPVMGHQAFLTQILSNLLGNAVKFVPQGVNPFIRLRTEQLENWVRLWVEDNGIGIAKEDQQRIFGVFVRAHSRKEYEGTGIGLAIVRKAVERMGGRTGVESEAGKGSRFWIELPKAVDVSDRTDDRS